MRENALRGQGETHDEILDPSGHSRGRESSHNPKAGEALAGA